MGGLDTSSPNWLYNTLKSSTRDCKCHTNAAPNPKQVYIVLCRALLGANGMIRTPITFWREFSRSIFCPTAVSDSVQLWPSAACRHSAQPGVVFTQRNGDLRWTNPRLAADNCWDHNSPSNGQHLPTTWQRLIQSSNCVTYDIDCSWQVTEFRRYWNNGRKPGELEIYTHGPTVLPGLGWRPRLSRQGWREVAPGLQLPRIQGTWPFLGLAPGICRLGAIFLGSRPSANSWESGLEALT